MQNANLSEQSMEFAVNNQYEFAFDTKQEQSGDFSPLFFFFGVKKACLYLSSISGKCSSERPQVMTYPHSVRRTDAAVNSADGKNGKRRASGERRIALLLSFL